MRHLIAVLFSVCLLSACSDGLVSTDTENGLLVDRHIQQQEDSNKFRNGHMLPSAATIEGIARGKGGGKPGSGSGGSTPTDPIDDGSGSADSGTLTGLVFGLDTQAIMERYGLLERYSVLERYALVERYGVVERFSYEHVFDGFAIWANSSEIDALIAQMVADPDIAWVEPDILLNRTPLALSLVSEIGVEYLPWGTAQVGAYGYSGTGVDLYVIDTGVSHADVPLASSIDLREGGTDPADGDGHGTHVAALAAASANGTDLLGAAPGVRVHSLKVLQGDESSDTDEVELAASIAAVEHVVAQRITNPNQPMVINFSLGADVGTPAYNALDEAIAAAVNTGITVVVSAGNAGIDASTVTPAHVNEAITVGSYGVGGTFSSFSNYGAVVDLLAPGEALPSLSSSATGQTGLSVRSGTSQSAALVSGAAALFLAANPQGTPAQVEGALRASARPEIKDAPIATTNGRLDVGVLMNRSIPPFFDFAVTAGGSVQVTGGVTITSKKEGVNANVFTNGALAMHTRKALVEGFGYYGTTLEGFGGSAFKPVYNPGGAPALQQQDPIAVPGFDAAAYAHLATQSTAGDLTLSGHYQLGTRENPTVWYVDGNIVTGGNVSFSGYGVFLSTGLTEFTHSVTSEEKGESSLAFYATGPINLYRRGSELGAQLFSGSDVVIGQSDITIHGSITASGTVYFNSNNTYLRQLPVSEAITGLFW